MEQVAEALWVVDGQTVSFHGFPYPTRSVVVRFGNGDLWVWSPIALTPDLLQQVNAVGIVRYLVSPNKLHHLYLQDWKAAYPEAQLWGPRSTVRKRPDLNFRGILDDTPPPEWTPDIDQAWFRGSFAMDEIAFCHRPSATTIIADLMQRFSDEFLQTEWGRWRWLARLRQSETRQATGDHVQPVRVSTAGKSCCSCRRCRSCSAIRVRLTDQSGKLVSCCITAPSLPLDSLNAS